MAAGADGAESTALAPERHEGLMREGHGGARLGGRSLARTGPFAVLAVPGWVAVAQLFHLGDRTVAKADYAAIELGVRNAVRAHQLLGPYSRFALDYGWFHPGPAMFYALAPWYALAGSRANGLALGAAVISLVLIGLVVRCVQLVHGTSAAWVAAALTALFLVRYDVERLRDPWNPSMVVLPVAALVVLVPVLADVSRRWPLPVFVVLAGAAVQTHVGTLPVVAALGATGALVVVVAARRGDRATRVALATRAIVAAAAGLVLWSPPVYEQLRDRPGNLRLLWRFARSVAPTSHTASDVLGPVGSALALRPAPLAVRFGPESPSMPPVRVEGVAWIVLVVVVAAVGAAAFAVARAGSGVGLDATGGPRPPRFALDGRRWALVAAVVAPLAAIAGASRVVGELYGYLFTPALGAALALWLTVGATFAAALEHRAAERDRSIPWTVPAAAVWLAAGSLALVPALAAHADLGESARSWAHGASTIDDRAILDGVRALCQRSGPVAIRGASAPWYTLVESAVVLERCGRHVELDLAYVVGARYSAKVAATDVLEIGPRALITIAPDAEVVAIAGDLVATATRLR